MIVIKHDLINKNNKFIYKWSNCSNEHFLVHVIICRLQVQHIHVVKNLLLVKLKVFMKLSKMIISLVFAESWFFNLDMSSSADEKKSYRLPYRWYNFPNFQFHLEDHDFLSWKTKWEFQYHWVAWCILSGTLQDFGRFIKIDAVHSLFYASS